MLVTLKQILAIAEERKIAVGAFNVPNLESIQAEIAAAEELNLPVIIQFAQGHETHIRLEEIGPIMVTYAKNARVPVCVHLDHGEDLAFLQKALDLGFTGVMYDGSTLPYEENVANTKKAVEMARKAGAYVEAELGSMGRREDGSGEGTGVNDETKIYTDPVLAKKFMEETGIDALACSFGTTHGLYLTEPKLDFSVVEKVREACDGLPVVMHGGSGVSVSDFHKAVRAGVRKINYFTYMDKAAGNAMVAYLESLEKGQVPFYSDAALKAIEAMKENVKRAMTTFALLDA